MTKENKISTHIKILRKSMDGQNMSYGDVMYYTLAFTQKAQQPVRLLRQRSRRINRNSNHGFCNITSKHPFTKPTM